MLETEQPVVLTGGDEEPLQKSDGVVARLMRAGNGAGFRLNYPDS